MLGRRRSGASRYGHGMPFLTIGQARFGYDEAGSGEPVVLVHAGCADRRMWRHQLDAFAGTHRVISYDWRGYGESDDATEPVSRHGDLLAVLDATGVDRAVVVGASDGGRAAVDAALAAPERIAGLVLLAPGLSGHTWPDSMPRRYRAAVHDSIGVDRLAAYRTGTAGRIDPDDLDTYCRAETRFLVAGPDRAASDLQPEVWRLALAMDRDLTTRAWTVPPAGERRLDPPAAERLAQVRAATLVVNGLADVPEITELGRLIAAGIPGARRVVLPDTGHLPALERPEAVNAAIGELLRSVPR